MDNMQSFSAQGKKSPEPPWLRGKTGLLAVDGAEVPGVDAVHQFSVRRAAEVLAQHPLHVFILVDQCFVAVVLHCVQHNDQILQGIGSPLLYSISSCKLVLILTVRRWLNPDQRRTAAQVRERRPGSHVAQYTPRANKSQMKKLLICSKENVILLLSQYRPSSF